MTESQSRYSIVERLTQRKLDIMSAKSDLKEELRHKQQRIDELKKNLDNWKEDVEEDIKRQRRDKEREVAKAELAYKNATERIVEKEKVFDEKIQAIQDALNAIEEISKTSQS